MFNYVKGQSAIMNIVTHEGYKGQNSSNTKDAINNAINNATRDCYLTNQKKTKTILST